MHSWLPATSSNFGAHSRAINRSSIAIGLSAFQVQITMARRGIASVARLCARAAAESEGLLARQVSRPALISLLGSADAAAAGAARVPARTFTSSPTIALSEAEYACVFYPEPEAEVGEQAPGFSLSGEW